MKTLISKILLILVIGGLTLFSSCRKETNDPITDTGTTITPGRTITTSIGGEVIDESGNSVSGATVTIGSKTMQTNTNGLFLFRDIPVNENKAYVKVEKNGFFLGSRNLMTRENSVSSVKIKLLSNSTVATFSSTTGGTISHEGVSLNFPASSIKIEGGGLYSGTVNAAIKFLDPNANDIGEIMPGDLRALNTNGDERLLETFGMASIELTSPTGQKLNVADGKTIELTIPLSGVYLADAPATIPLWYFDETNGIWKEEGSATKIGSNYVGDVSHFSFWNCDNPNPSTTIQGKLVCGTNPLTNNRVSITNSSGRILGTTGTDNLGNFSGFIPMNTALVIKVYTSNPCDLAPIYTNNIGPFTSPANLATIIACSSGINSAILKGKLIDCSGNVIVNGVLTVNDGGRTSHFFANAMGEINTHYNYCSSSSVSISADDFINNRSSTPQTFSTGPTIHFGTILVCNLYSTTEYFHYNIDGTNYNIVNDNAGRNLYSSLQSPITGIQGSDFSNYYSGLGNISCSFFGDSIGTFNASNFNVNHIGPVTYNINITISNYGNVGAYITGILSGTYTEFSTTHTINGRFNIKRYR